MKEFIEKLLDRLEELKTFKLNLADAMSELVKKDRLDNYISKEEVVEIVNQLAEEYKPKIRADKIRSMTDGELAIFLVNFKNTFGEEYEGEQSCLDWLKSEIKEV